MKRIISFLLICFLACSTLFVLAGCVGGDKENNGDGTGEGTNDGGKDPVRDESNTVHIIVLAGQSGARGKALVNDLKPEDKEINEDVDILADGLPMGELGNIPGIDESKYFEPLEPGYGDFYTEFGPEIGMGQTLASVYPKIDTDYKTIIVKYTASGSTFTDHWYSTSLINDSEANGYLNLDQASETAKGSETGPLTNNLYALVDRAVNELLELGYDVVIDGMAFVHGEQDAKFDSNMAIYEKALRYFIDDFRAYFENSEMPVVITEALTNSAAYSNTLREIQADVASSMNNVSLVGTGDLTTNTFEPWHFGAESNNILGNRIAAEIASYNETRVVKSIDEEIINVPLGVKVELPDYVKASFTNYYSGYLKVEEYSSYDCNKAGLQEVSFKAETAEGLKEFSLKINVSESVAFVDGKLTEYASAKANSLPDGLGTVYVIKGDKGLYIAADVKDSQIFTDGENWHKGDMGQHGNNDDFIIYITDSDAAARKTICLSAANLLRVYDSGISLDASDSVLALGNLLYNKKISDYEYHVTTNGLVNGDSSDGMTLEVYISYEDLGIKNPDLIKLCFNYNNVSSSSSGRIDSDNYFVNGSIVDGAEENTDSYFAIGTLIN
ncbi:MAG: hypothetical protein IJX58_03385 [Clostridia bacterium]|nr:hypothetical protein [Clostridia bacterium]